MIGDSLTKEYEAEFPILNPTNPAAWGERNWIELLATHRPEHVDIGPYSVWLDSRLTGHEYNWAFPGSTSEEWREILEAGIISEYFLLRLAFDPYLDTVADRVVIFLGGNDLKNNYRPYYEGADPEPFIASLISNIRVIIDYVRGRNATVPIVLVNMPDVGVTPTVQEERPDPEGRARNTALTEETNRRLQLLAVEKGIGFADIGALTSQLTGPDAFVIAGARFEKSVDPEALSNESKYLFSPDGFHPNTAAQLLFANAIADGFNTAYPALTQVPLFSTEEMLDILGIEADMAFSEWAAAYGIDPSDPMADADGDGLTLFQEYGMGYDPRLREDGGPIGRWTGSRLALRYAQRVANSQHVEVLPQSSPDLQVWAPVEMVTPLAPLDARREYDAFLEPTMNRGFLRLTVRSR